MLIKTKYVLTQKMRMGLKEHGCKTTEENDEIFLLWLWKWIQIVPKQRKCSNTNGNTTEQQSAIHKGEIFCIIKFLGKDLKFVNNNKTISLE